MFGFIKRLFGGNNNTIKDPQLGKVRYLESENGHVWSGHFLGQESHSHVTFFIESEEKVLRHEPRNKLLDVVDGYDDVLSIINQQVIHEAPSHLQDKPVLQFVHVPFANDRYDIELICAAGELAFSILLNDMQAIDFIRHED